MEILPFSSIVFPAINLHWLRGFYNQQPGGWTPFFPSYQHFLTTYHQFSHIHIISISYPYPSSISIILISPWSPRSTDGRLQELNGPRPLRCGRHGVQANAVADDVALGTLGMEIFHGDLPGKHTQSYGKKHIKDWFKRNIYFGKPEIFHGKIYGIYDDPAG